MNKKEALFQALARGRLLHAVIVTGNGAESLCERAAQVALCEGESENKPCMRCKGCDLFSANAHPDLLRLAPEPKKKSIGVDPVRDLLDALSTVPAREKNRAVIIPAEKLTDEAQTALLKTLEEPPQGTAFFLFGNDNALLPTIRSRCLILRLAEDELPPNDEADEKAKRLVSSLLAQKVLDRSLFPTERGELDDLLERLAADCAKKFQKTQKGALNQAVDILTEARKRLTGNANAKMLIDWVRVKLERLFA
jgi:DNA polymerase III delta prime subunit